jgi:hypothetical protein
LPAASYSTWKGSLQPVLHPYYHSTINGRRLLFADARVN